MKLLLIVFVFFSMVNQSLFAGQVALSQTTIELQRTQGERFSFRFCEMGFCRDFGNPKGYDLEAFENMNQSCQQKRRIHPILASVLDGLSYAVLLGMPTGAGVLVFVAGQTVSDSLEKSVDQSAVKMANDLIPALSRNNGKFEFLFEDFVSLKRGLEYCHQLYEKTPGIWLEDCDRDPICKNELSKTLDLPPKKIKSMTAHEIYTLKVEKQTADFYFESKFGLPYQ